MDTSAMKYPFGRCAHCGKEFNSELRNEYEIIHCPWCGELILDYFNDANPSKGLVVKPDLNRFIYCEDCGQRIYECSAGGKSGDWLYKNNRKGPGVCSGPCERELCGDCADWDDSGMCNDCYTSAYETCDECPIPGCREGYSTCDCDYPCYDCPMKNDCLTDETDKRHECHAFQQFIEDHSRPCSTCGKMTERKISHLNEVYRCDDCEKKLNEAVEKELQKNKLTGKPGKGE